MLDPTKSTAELIQDAVARLLATSPAGHLLFLIGGFRYRFLDQSARVSHDIDYHWAGDLEAKQVELISLFSRRLLPEIRRRLGYQGDVRAATGADAQSPAVRIIELAFWREGVAYSRIEIPVEITRIICLDPPIARTVGGVVYPTASDADLIESKVIALLNRPVIEHRDFCDIFLFASHLLPDSSRRLLAKLLQLGVARPAVAARMRHIQDNAAYHTRAIQAVISTQLDQSAAANLNAAGGARMVYDAVLRLLQTLGLAVEIEP